jgi:hypothetical protein
MRGSHAVNYCNGDCVQGMVGPILEVIVPSVSSGFAHVVDLTASLGMLDLAAAVLVSLELSTHGVDQSWPSLINASWVIDGFSIFTLKPSSESSPRPRLPKNAVPAKLVRPLSS